MHTHWNEDEYSFVLEGRIGIELGKDILKAGPGDLFPKPRGVPHAFWNAGEEPTRLARAHLAPGFEDYFRAKAPLLAPLAPRPP